MTPRRAAAAKSGAEAYAELFPAVYLQFHRRDGKRRELSGSSRAVLLHLSIAGPLTVGECAKHFDRAQSVVSEFVEHLERDGLLARVRDEKGGMTMNTEKHSCESCSMPIETGTYHYC